MTNRQLRPPKSTLAFMCLLLCSLQALVQTVGALYSLAILHQESVLCVTVHSQSHLISVWLAGSVNITLPRCFLPHACSCQPQGLLPEIITFLSLCTLLCDM
ncbi:hypothetical protein F5Y17DRAFT_236282 [Xylariaceae sp. FL0594]|nr:hypothetical protein F5Y17DRAFT_236282 [Xylariaceae sp. FL0594]